VERLTVNYRRPQKNLWLRALSGLVFLVPSFSHADPYEKLSRKIAAVAERAGLARVAILPLKPINGRSRQGGLILSERLVSHMAGRAGIQVVERTLLEKILEEQKLGTSGVLNQEEAKEVGRILGVDALVTGTYTPLKADRLEVHTRLIDAESARILGVAQAKVRKEWEDDAFAIGEQWTVDAPDLGDFPAPKVEALPASPFLDARDFFRDAPRATIGCDDWENRVDELQESVIEAKARFWATRLLDPNFDRRAITRNPGSEIRNMSLRSRFYERTKQLYNATWRAGIDLSETVRIDSVKAEVDRLVDRCY
jgi:TolB-like protein